MAAEIKCQECPIHLKWTHMISWSYLFFCSEECLNRYKKRNNVCGDKK
jgi:hypothetical protein